MVVIHIYIMRVLLTVSNTFHSHYFTCTKIRRVLGDNNNNNNNISFGF